MPHFVGALGHAPYGEFLGHASVKGFLDHALVGPLPCRSPWPHLLSTVLYLSLRALSTANKLLLL